MSLFLQVPNVYLGGYTDRIHRSVVVLYEKPHYTADASLLIKCMCAYVTDYLDFTHNT